MATKRDMAAARDLLARCARACSAYGDDVVIGGRMALELYRMHPDLRRSDAPVSQATREVDVVVPRRLPLKGKSIVERLEQEGLVAHDGFALDLRRGRGKRKFQEAHHGSDRAAPQFIEFLTPRVKNEEAFHEPQAGIVASPLRYVELLLFEPLVVSINDSEVHVAAPSMFIAQKLLMRTSDTGPREVKDLVSVYEACLLSEPRWSLDRDVFVRAAKKSATWATWLAKVPALIALLFARAPAEGCVAVSAALRGQPRAPSGSDVEQIVMRAAGAMFGSLPR